MQISVNLKVISHKIVRNYFTFYRHAVYFYALMCQNIKIRVNVRKEVLICQLWIF